MAQLDDSFYDEINSKQLLFNKASYSISQPTEKLKQLIDTLDDEKDHNVDSEIPAFLRGRDDELHQAEPSDPPELKAFIKVLSESEDLQSISIIKKNKLIEEFKNKLDEEIAIKNRFYAKLARPGARTRIRNIVDRYVRGNDKTILTISDLKKKVINDGYLTIDPSPDAQGNMKYKETEKLKSIFGKDLKNDSITDSGLNETIRRALDEIEVTSLNVGV